MAETSSALAQLTPSSPGGLWGSAARGLTSLARRVRPSGLPLALGSTGIPEALQTFLAEQLESGAHFAENRGLGVPVLQSPTLGVSSRVPQLRETRRDGYKNGLSPEVIDLQGGKPPVLRENALEGWPRYSTLQKEGHAKELHQILADIDKSLEASSISGEFQDDLLEQQKIYQTTLARVENPATVFRLPGNESLYNRYKKELEPYITKLGGRPFTDKEGNTWLEVPLAGQPGRVKLFSLGTGGLTFIGIRESQTEEAPS